jgi:hypothetical protein
MVMSMTGMTRGADSAAGGVMAAARVGTRRMATTKPPAHSHNRSGRIRLNSGRSSGNSR